MTDDLKPCYCGRGRAEIRPTEFNNISRIKCLMCGLESLPFCIDIPNMVFDAINQWNTRPIEDDLRQQIDRLTKERDEARRFGERLCEWRNKRVAGVGGQTLGHNVMIVPWEEPNQ